MRGRRIIVAVVGALVVAGSIGYVVGSAADQPVSRGERTGLPGFSKVAFLSHTNNPARVPVFPGDPPFTMSTTFTVPQDGFYLQYVKEGEHTGTHYSAPCHFHVQARCADQLDPGDFVLPAVVIDVRAKVSKNVDYEVSVADLKAWESTHGQIPPQSAVLLWTGCDRWLGPRDRRGRPHLLQLRDGQGEVPATGVLEAGGAVADPHRRARTARSARHRHVRARSGDRSAVPGDVAHAAETPLHAGEPHEPGCDAIARRVDRDRRTEEPARFGGAEHDLRLGSLRGTHRSARGPTKGRGQAGSALGQGAPLARPVRVEQSWDRRDGEVAGGRVADLLDRHRERHRPLGVGPR